MSDITSPDRVPESPMTDVPPDLPGPLDPEPSLDELGPFIPADAPDDAEALDASRLLAQAVGQLPEADRDRV